MKKTLFSAVLLMAAAMTYSCEKCSPIVPDDTEEPGMALLDLSVELPKMEQTKAVAPYTGSVTYETVVNNTQFLVFDMNGALNAYITTDGKEKQVSVTKSNKKVYAVVNGPDLSQVKTEAEAEAFALDLSLNSRDESKGFVMSGSSTCQMTSNVTICTVSVKRLVARVALSKVMNLLPPSYDKLTIERVWLSNVVGNQNVAGNAAPSVWYNQEGRADESTRVQGHIINGDQYKASCESLTHIAMNLDLNNQTFVTDVVPYLMYAYPNSSTTKPDGFKTPFAAQSTVLVIATSIAGQKYYYPVVLDKAELARNTSYTVEVTITGLGSDDPNKPVSKADLRASVFVEPWVSGVSYEEVI